MSRMRQSVVDFALAMERELQTNDHKDGWADLSPKWLLNRMRQEMGELASAIEQKSNVEHIESEAADVANFAMMIAENYRRANDGGLRAPHRDGERG